MEKSTDYLTYKGSISEAIIEAQKQKKLFLIFISGEDENSTNLENSTWLDDRVASAVSKYCIFLHLIHGHVEALQFSAIYPQKSVPSISAVGYNGVMLWQHEGYINGESFVQSIEKAWAAMNLQDTAAVLLSAALASKKPEPSGSSSVDFAPVERGGSSDLLVPSSLPDNQALTIQDEQSNDAVASLADDLALNIQDEQSNDAVASLADDRALNVQDEQSNDAVASLADDRALNIQDEQSNDAVASVEQQGEDKKAMVHMEDSESREKEGRRSVPDEIMDRENTIKSAIIHLSIRMPAGTSLQEKFAAADRLRSVKNYVDENHGSNLGSYDLAIPYPRRVFGEEDMSKSLSELGFAGRQALMVISKSEISGYQRGPLASNDIQISANQITSNDNSIGYFGYLKRALSYMNPLSYLGGGNGDGGPSSSRQPPNDDSWQYRPNPGLQNSLLSAEALQNPQHTNGRRASRPFGSNIHTLRREEEEDESSSRDRNIFWNGNSTQYGGNDK